MAVDAQAGATRESVQEAILLLLTLARDVATAPSEDQAAWHIVNRSFELQPYRLAWLWRPSGPVGGQVSHASGLARVEQDSPFVVWAARLGRQLAAASDGQQAFRQLTVADVPPDLACEWQDWLPEYLLWIPLPAPAAPWPGALCLACDQPVTPEMQLLLQELALFYGQGLWGWQRQHRDWRSRWRAWRQRRAFRLAAWGLLACLLLPLRLSVVVPGEVVPAAPRALTAPTDVPVHSISVRPNEVVSAGQVLFRLDDTTTRNRLAVARQTLEIARAEWLRASQKGFGDDASRAEVATLNARIQEKQAEVAYLEELLERLTVRAPSDGVVVFGDPLELVGRPVQTGEQIMMLADPADVALVAWLPAADAIALQSGAEMRLSLYIRPLSSMTARVQDSSYETQLTDEGISAYRVRGQFEADSERPHLGLKGTVRLYGERLPLIYHLLRRPLAALRRQLGF